MSSRKSTWLAFVLCCTWSASAFSAESMDASQSPSSASPGAGPTSTPGEGPTPTPTPGVTPVPPDREEPEVRRTPEGVPSLQISPDFVSPAMAFGGYFPVPQVKGGAVRVEPFSIRASVNASLGYDDNVRLSRTNKISSMFFSLSPSIAAGLEGRTQRYYAVYRGNYGRYLSAAENNYENHNFGLSAANEWTGRLRTLAQYEFLRGYDPAGTTAGAVGTPNAWNLHSVRGTVTYGAVGAPAQIDANAGYSNRAYATNRAVTAAGDYEQLQLGATVSYRVAPKTRASMEITRSNITRKLDPLADSTENRYLLGVTWNATAKTQGTLRAGYMTKEFVNSAAPSFSAPSYEAQATWSPRTYSVFNLTAQRTFAEASEPGSTFVVVNTASLTWNHAWFERFRSTLGYLYGSENRGGLGRTDTYQTFDAKVSYAIWRRLLVGAEFRHDVRASPDATLEYKRNLTLFTIEAAL